MQKKVTKISKSNGELDFITFLLLESKKRTGKNEFSEVNHEEKGTINTRFENNEIKLLEKKEEELFPVPKINPGILKNVLDKYIKDEPIHKNSDEDLEEKLIQEIENNYRNHFSSITPELLESISKRAKYKKIIKKVAKKPVYIYPLLNEVGQKTRKAKEKTIEKLSPNPWAARLSATCFIALFLSIYVARLAPDFSDKFTATIDQLTLKPIIKTLVMINNFVKPKNTLYKNEIVAGSETGKMMLGSYIKENSQKLAQNKNTAVQVNENDIVQSYGNYYPGVVVLGASYPEEEQDQSILKRISDNLRSTVQKIADTQIQASLYLHKKLIGSGK